MQEGVPRFDAAESARYGRHLVLPEIGPAGQDRLRNSSVAVVGAGGLGSAALQYLAAAGVGRIGIVDHDSVALSNLQRQVIYATARTGRPKATEAAARLRELNPLVVTEAHTLRLSAVNAEDILSGYDLILDGSDNFPARYLLNDAALLLGVPLVHGSVHRFEGQVAVFCRPGGPCYRCLFPEPPPAGLVPDCARAGVLGVLPGIVGAIQAAEAVKLITGAGRTLSGRVLFVDMLGTSFREVSVRADPACPSCGRGAARGTLRDYDDVRSPAHAGQAHPRSVPEVSPRELAGLLAEKKGITILDVREPEEFEAGNIGGTSVPLGELRSRMGGFDRARPIVVVCSTGERSALAAGTLLAAGFGDVRNLAGGLQALWSGRGAAL
jgi:molybdopterin/thiamine biosynthesis adenylyltransferase/rhodanese-related sulfurtransferase